MLHLDFQAKSYLFDKEFSITAEDWQKDIFHIFPVWEIAALP